MRDEAIERYLPFAKQRARVWANRFRSKKEDLEGVAYLAMVKAFSKCVPETDLECRKYLSTCIGNAIRDYLVYDKLMPIPKNELARLKELEESPQTIALDGEGMVEQLKRYSPRQGERLDFLELVEKLDLSHRDLQILHMVMDGYTQTETAKQVGCVQSTVAKTLQRIAQKYAETRIPNARPQVRPEEA